jgi:hypothetical protein
MRRRDEGEKEKRKKRRLRRCWRWMSQSGLVITLPQRISADCSKQRSLEQRITNEAKNPITESRRIRQPDVG